MASFENPEGSYALSTPYFAQYHLYSFIKYAGCYRKISEYFLKNFFLVDVIVFDKNLITSRVVLLRPIVVRIKRRTQWCRCRPSLGSSP